MQYIFVNKKNPFMLWVLKYDNLIKIKNFVILKTYIWSSIFKRTLVSISRQFNPLVTEKAILILS